MQKLAEKYAKLKKTRVLDHVIKDDVIVFVLESGPKLTMTEAELSLAVAKLEPAESAPKAEKKSAPKAEKEKK